MAGSLDHLKDSNGNFTSDLIEDLGDAHEALEECFNRIKELEDGHKDLIQKVAAQGHEIEQILGQALGYPWFKDDPKNFPDATEKDGVCVGDHTPVTLAMEAAQRLGKPE